MKKLIIIFFFFITSGLFAQSGIITWTKIINVTNDSTLMQKNNFSDVPNKPLAISNLGAVAMTDTLDKIMTPARTATLIVNALLGVADTNLSNIDVDSARIKLQINNVDNTSDANKPVSTAQQSALDLKANIASPNFTGFTTFTSTGVPLTGEPNYFIGNLTTLTDNHYNLRSTFNLNSSTNNNAYRIAGILGESYIAAGNTGALGFAVGTYGYVQNYGTGLVAKAIGAYNVVANRGSGTVTATYGSFTQINVDSGTVITNYGNYINTPSITTGSIGVNYGLYINNQVVGTTNYTLYSTSLAKSYLAGNLTLNNGLTVQWGDPKSIYYNGTSSYTSIANNSNLSTGTTDFSLELFVKTSSTTGARIIYRAESNIGYQIEYRTSGKFRFSINDGTHSAEIIGVNAINDGKWHHIICKRESNKIWQYIDGELDDSISCSTVGSISNTASLFLGSLSAVSNLWNGEIGLFRVYNFALSSSEIIKKFNNGRPDLTEVDYKYKYGSQTALTSGTLEIGKTYIMDDWITDDDFANVATVISGTINTDGCIFLCTGTTPTTWTNSSSLRKLGAILDYKPENCGNYSWIDNSSNKLHGINIGLGISQNEKKRIAYLLTTSTTPTMTDVIDSGWKVSSIAISTGENLTEIDATQETSSIELLTDKTLNNGKMIWNVTDHNIYTTPKDIVFKLTGNGGSGSEIFIILEKIM